MISDRSSPQAWRIDPAAVRRSRPEGIPLRPTRLAVVCDFPEEGWASMDLVGEMILAHLVRPHSDQAQATRICPPFQRRLTRWPVVGRAGQAWNADRVLN